MRHRPYTTTTPPRRRTYDRVSEVLAAYLSPVMVKSTLSRALAERGLTAESLEAEALQDLIAHCMVGLRLFVEPQRLPELMLKLTELMDERGGT